MDQETLSQTSWNVRDNISYCSLTITGIIVSEPTLLLKTINTHNIHAEMNDRIKCLYSYLLDTIISLLNVLRLNERSLHLLVKKKSLKF